MERQDIKMYLLHCENIYILKMLGADNEFIQRLEQRWKDNEKDISNGSIVFNQKIEGHPEFVREITDAFETVGIIVRAKINRLCNESMHSEAEELERALKIINSADYNH